MQEKTNKEILVWVYGKGGGLVFLLSELIVEDGKDTQFYACMKGSHSITDLISEFFQGIQHCQLVVSSAILTIL